MPTEGTGTLIVSHTGYRSDTLPVRDTAVLEIVLRERGQLEGVVVSGGRNATYIANLPMKVEVITSLELKKAACCDLAGCFETQASVQPQTTNIVTNSKELRILGLSGIYNQVLVDGLPMIQGGTYTYGISSIPGPLVENIWVAKGANSVLQGYESISGQINVLTREPDRADKLLLNGYLNSFGESHYNALFSHKKGKWSSLGAVHVVQPAATVDRDHDGFLDVSKLTRYMAFNRWKRGNEAKWGWSTQIGVRFLSEKRIGGQTGFSQNLKGSDQRYGQLVQIDQPEAWVKLAYRMNDEHRFALYTSGFYQHQESYFGVTKYAARQSNAYANLQHEWTYAPSGVLKTGFSYRNLRIREAVGFSNNSLGRTYAGDYHRNESVPGVFAENTLNLFSDKLTWMFGVRADHHNRFGWTLTPRTLLRYKAGERTDLRASIGTGWRTANIFSENVGLLASSRDIRFAEELEPERALNYGLSLTQRYKGTNVEGALSLDLYHTRFQNQIFPDYDASPTLAVIRNFRGRSVSNAAQAEVSGVFYKRVSAKVGYVFLDVHQVRGGVKETLPFNPKHRVHTSFSFQPLSKRWHLDANMHWYGRQWLPDTKANPEPFRMPDQSNPYTVVSAQFTYNLSKSWELYTGVENLFGFRQRRPLIGWQDPFGAYFDTQFAWGPTRGREGYIGFRFRL
ncbi:TonB-dependent receptor plug domain-containing protein [Flaviaesturariibacter amylovorans]|uniref:TonB-dependent receptor plug domain-containing protein n=2 Tax=Flaviaesturariibacter amylovorans TaxID=1084520 RepID=A0ABP8HLQ5_9BACT